MAIILENLLTLTMLNQFNQVKFKASLYFLALLNIFDDVIN